MEKDSDQTEISTEIANDTSENGTRTNSQDSKENELKNHRSRGATSNLSNVNIPVRKHSFGSQTTQKKKFGYQKSTGLNKNWNWKTNKGLIYGSSSGDKQSSKIALFDMDGTLIINRNGRRVTDWEFFNPSVPQKLKELKEKGFRIVIASNQMGISLDLVSATDLQNKIEQFTAAAGVEATAMMASKKDKFRKPETGMWYFLLSSLNSSFYNVDMKESVVFILV